MPSQASPLTEEEEWCPNLGVLCSSEAINTKARAGGLRARNSESEGFSHCGTAGRDVLRPSATPVHPADTTWSPRDRLHQLMSESESGRVCSSVCATECARDIQHSFPDEEQRREILMSGRYCFRHMPDPDLHSNQGKPRHTTSLSTGTARNLTQRLLSL